MDLVLKLAAPTWYASSAAGTHYQGRYTSDEMPWYLNGVPYDYAGHPGLACAIEAVAREQGSHNRAITGIGRIAGTVTAVDAPRASALGVGHPPTDGSEVRRVALGVDDRVPERLKRNLRRAKGSR